VAATCLGSGYAGLVEPNWLTVEKVEASLPGLHPDLDGLRVALFSDVHYPRKMPAERVRRACRAAMAFEPDLVVVPGDFVDGHTRVKTVPSMRGLFDELEAPLGVYGVLGNHDHALDGHGVARAVTRQTPIRLLDNDRVPIVRGRGRLWLAGTDDMRYGFPDPGKALRDLPPDEPRLFHNPDFAETMKPGEFRVDLQLSGHTHGGETWLPLLTPMYHVTRFPEKFLRGFGQGAAHRVYVTRGVGRPRGASLLSLPEVTWLTLRSAPAQSG
jgi:uncharacterized protein